MHQAVDELAVRETFRGDDDVGQREQLAHAARKLAGIEQNRDALVARLFRDGGLQGGLRSVDDQHGRVVQEPRRQVAGRKRGDVAARTQDLAPTG